MGWPFVGRRRHSWNGKNERKAPTKAVRRTMQNVVRDLKMIILVERRYETYLGGWRGWSDVYF